MTQSPFLNQYTDEEQAASKIVARRKVEYVHMTQSPFLNQNTDEEQVVEKIRSSLSRR